MFPDVAESPDPFRCRRGETGGIARRVADILRDDLTPGPMKITIRHHDFHCLAAKLYLSQHLATTLSGMSDAALDRGFNFGPTMTDWTRDRPFKVAFAVSVMIHAALIAFIPGLRAVPIETPRVLEVEIAPAGCTAEFNAFRISRSRQLKAVEPKPNPRSRNPGPSQRPNRSCDRAQPSPLRLLVPTSSGYRVRNRSRSSWVPQAPSRVRSPGWKPYPSRKLNPDQSRRWLHESSLAWSRARHRQSNHGRNQGPSRAWNRASKSGRR